MLYLISLKRIQRALEQHKEGDVIFYGDDVVRVEKDPSSILACDELWIGIEEVNLEGRDRLRGDRI